jgi:hypothetical protein
MAPYSLGKLIDWKLVQGYESVVIRINCTPYSLGKLIDWKLGSDSALVALICSHSLLVREIN